MTKYDKLNQTEQAINSLRPRSAWRKGVKAYALGFLDDLREFYAYGDNAPETREALESMLLNGANNWRHYSQIGNALISNYDICKRLATPSGQKRTKDGQREPRARETWLDVQGRALWQACEIVKRCFTF